MPRKKGRGICSSCMRADACQYTNSARQVTLNCDEYAGRVEHAPNNPGSVSMNSSQRLVREEQNRAHKALGLCRSCEGARSCTFPKPEGGVWHCEEYR